MSMYFNGTFTAKNRKVEIKLNLLMDRWMWLKQEIKWIATRPHGHFGNMLEGSTVPSDIKVRKGLLDKLMKEQNMINYELKELLTTNDFDVDSA